MMSTSTELKMFRHSFTLLRITGYLDEIAEMPIELQVKQLRVRETGKLLCIGGDRLEQFRHLHSR